MFIKFLTWFSSTRACHIYVDRALKKNSSIFMYIFSILCFLPFFIAWNNLFDPVLDLNKMQKSRGKIIEFQMRVKHSKCGDTVTLKNMTGIIEEYHLFSSRFEYDFLQNNIGKEVVIWSQPEPDIFKTCHRIFQMQYGDELITDYSQIKPRRLKMKIFDPYIMGICLALSMLPMIYIYFRFRADDTD